MSAFFNLVLAPFSALLTVAYARPWTAIVLSALLAVGAEVLHRELWMGTFACFAAYMLMWLDEMQHPAEPFVEEQA